MTRPLARADAKHSDVEFEERMASFDPNEKFFYIQNRGTCGNSVSWWAIGDHGYTCDLRCAKVWTREEVERRDWRSFDKPWPKSAVDRLVQHHVDIQDLTHRDNEGRFYPHPHTLMSHRPDLTGGASYG